MPVSHAKRIDGGLYALPITRGADMPLHRCIALSYTVPTTTAGLAPDPSYAVWGRRAGMLSQ
jgi:hypothetical protein